MDEFPSPIDLTFSAIAFFIGWAYAIYTYGFFLGAGLGWIPALFLAIMFMFLWRFLLLIVLAAGAIVGLLIWARLS